MVRCVRASSPESKIIVFSDDTDQAMLLKLWRIPIHGYLSWTEAKLEILNHAIPLVLLGVRVGAPGAMDATVAPENRPEEAMPALIENEQLIFEGLEAYMEPAKVCKKHSI